MMQAGAGVRRNRKGELSEAAMRRKSANALRVAAPHWIFDDEDRLELSHRLTSLDDVESVTTVLDFSRSMVGISYRCVGFLAFLES